VPKRPIPRSGSAYPVALPEPLLLTLLSFFPRTTTTREKEHSREPTERWRERSEKEADIKLKQRSVSTPDPQENKNKNNPDEKQTNQPGASGTVATSALEPKEIKHRKQNSAKEKTGRDWGGCCINIGAEKNPDLNKNDNNIQDRRKEQASKPGCASGAAAASSSSCDDSSVDAR
jgi:hypothetical protein